MSELKPCPFCGAGETDFRESKHWTGKSNKILSVSIYHWCYESDTPLRPFLQVKGKTREQAIERWNTRKEQEK